MLSAFRRGIFAKLMLVVLGIGLFAIVITGFGTGGSGLGGVGGAGSGNVARVDGQAITAAEVNDQLNRQLDRARQQQPELDMGRFLSGGALDEVVRQLITTTALMVFGRENGFAASAEMINREIAGIPAFQNMAGQFDRTAFERALQSERLTEAELRKEIEGMLIQRQLILPVAGSAKVPQAIALQYASLLLESRSGNVGLVPTAAMGGGREPTDQEIAAFYNESRTRYTVPERRVLRYAAFGPEQVAAAATATEAEIAAAYKANAATFAGKSTRNLTQLVLPSEAAARAVAAKVAGGTTLASAASQAGLSAATLTGLTREAYQRQTSPAVAEAAFAAAKGAVTGPAKSGLGWHVVRVDDIVTTAARPLAAVRGELAAQIGQRKAQEAMVALESRIQDAIQDGSSFEEVARAEKLAVKETAEITGAGAAPGNPAWRPDADVAALIGPGFEMEPDEDPVVEPIRPDERYALLAVGRVVPAAPPPLAQIRERVKADLVAKRGADRARAVAGSIVAKINAGTPAAQAFAQADVKLPPVQAVAARRMDIAQRGQQVPPPLAMMFSLPRGKARLLPAPNGAGWFVVYLDKVVPGNASGTPQLVQATQSQFSEVLGDEYAQQFTRAVQAKMKLERNAKALQDLRKQLTGGGAQ